MMYLQSLFEKNDCKEEDLFTSTKSMVTLYHLNGDYLMKYEDVMFSLTNNAIPQFNCTPAVEADTFYTLKYFAT